MNTLKKTALILMATISISGGASTIVPTSSMAKTRYVYIAPKHGKKYHLAKNCRGLRRAKKIQKKTLKWAKKHGYKMCRLG